MRAKWAVAAVVVVLLVAGGGAMYALHPARWHTMRGPIEIRNPDGSVEPIPAPTTPPPSTDSKPASAAPAPPSAPAPAVSSSTPAQTALPSVPAVPPPADPVASAKVQKNRQAVETFPGWLGVDVRLGQLVLVVVEMNDQAPATREFKSQFTLPCQVLWISADNTHGDQPHTIDPSTLEFHFADYHTLAVLPPSQVLATARPPMDAVLGRSNAPMEVAPKTVMPDIPAFLPAGTELTQAIAVTMKVDGQQVVIPGRYLSVEEKAERLRAGQSAQAPSKPTSSP